MSKGLIGVLTIGQSPRTDVMPSLEKILGEEIKLIERGALDRLKMEDMQLISPDLTEQTYISRLRNGEAVKIGKQRLLPLLQRELTELEMSVEVVMMLCTGDFPTLNATKPIIYPDQILTHTVQAISPTGVLGLIIPLEEQKETLIEKWATCNLTLITEVASPYEKSDVKGAAERLQQHGADLIVLDCMGYNEHHKKMAIVGSGLPVILPRTLTARIALEYVEK